MPKRTHRTLMLGIVGLCASSYWWKGVESFAPGPAATLPRLDRRGTLLAAAGGGAGLAESDTTKKTAAVRIKDAKGILNVGDCIGSGSYGTVHYLTFGEEDDKGVFSKSEVYIGKRPWNEEELAKREGIEDPKGRAARCLYYWEVEEHCFYKMPQHPQLPPYCGVVGDWMVFGLVGSVGEESGAGDGEAMVVAPTLSGLMKLDRPEPHKLKHIARTLVDEIVEGEDDFHALALDKFLESLLGILAHVHEQKIVHRDVKPENLLLHDGQVLLLDFGSAADLEPSTSVPSSASFVEKSLKRYSWGLGDAEQQRRVAVSPMYCAPEVFIEPRKAPAAFDIFSSALVFCQLLFGYLEERIDAGFHQQLEEVQWDPNAWLANELGSKLRPGGLDHALEYLAERPGLWKLLQEMFQPDPEQRPTAKQAQRRLQRILRNKEEDSSTETLEEADGSFFAMVVESMELCVVPTVSRPLHYVATFSRAQPLGIVFAEVDADGGDEDTSESPNDSTALWKEATKDALPGEVFVKELVEGGQAESLGILEVGDRLQGVGELTFTAGGFEKAVEMLQDQPKKSKFVTLHFDRVRIRANDAIPMVPNEDVEIIVADQGAWSVKGKRSSQEDTFVLHEIHDTKDRSILVMGVMDGHGGTAASTMVSEELPTMLSNQFVLNRLPLKDALETTWRNICLDYQQQCSNAEECAADFDSREGILMANTGSEDLVAGTTASMLTVDETNGELYALNCGDSRSIVVTAEGKIQLATEDHTPETEEERLHAGVAAGLDYSIPQCRFSSWTISAGAYEYAVGRSLEGPFVTSKGIVSDPDISRTKVAPGEILLSATDGLWGVVDSVEVAAQLAKMRKDGVNARDAARYLCSMALRKGSPDNISAVVVYL